MTENCVICGEEYADSYYQGYGDGRLFYCRRCGLTVALMMLMSMFESGPPAVCGACTNPTHSRVFGYPLCSERCAKQVAIAVLGLLEYGSRSDRSEE